jgi:subfamily B ATP-binding cassette protein MsbA
MTADEEITRRRQLIAIRKALQHRPKLTVAIITTSLFTALLEGVGLSFIVPIVEIVQASGDPATEADGVLEVFVTVYNFLGIHFSLGNVIVGVSVVLTLRWTMTFFAAWLRAALSISYIRELQENSFEKALDARVSYFDQEGSDDILNAIVTQAEWAGNVLTSVISFIEKFLLTSMYGLISFAVAPLLTLLTAVFLGGFTLFFRYVLEPGYDIGDRVADANERLQQTAQAGTQGIRETKMFGLKHEILEEFSASAALFAEAGIKKARNSQAIQNFYNLLTAISVFGIIYLAITFANLDLGVLGLFLFAIFRLGPKASTLNSNLYSIEGRLPHLVRAQTFLDNLEANSEPTGGKPAPSRVKSLTFDDVRLTYDAQTEPALDGISFDVYESEFIGFVGHSGAGKSTIVSALARTYDPEEGTIEANGTPITEMDIQDWRSRIAVVQQNPFIFNKSLRFNLTIGKRDATESELDRVCEIAKVDEFIDDLPNGYETELGDDGVRLSGGQRQRVALARALLKDADILVLDEATSDLDSNLEKQVQQAIEKMDREYIIIGIAHRLSTVQNADRIYTVEDGVIVESGSHEELLEHGGTYAELHSIQSRGVGGS